MFKECFDCVRKTKPLVHNITNYVTVNDVANMILACGASPVMADDEAEAADITCICGGLNINIGTLNQSTVKSMFSAGKKSNELGHKLVLDPVGAGASKFRTDTAVNLIKEIKFDVIRGNISEIKTLASGSGFTKGVDACASDSVTEENLLSSIDFIKAFAKKMNCVIAATGAVDLVSDSEKCFVIRNGRPEMSKITGTGCQLSGLTAAFIISNPDNVLTAAAAAVCAMGLAGEIGWRLMQEGDGNTAYRNKIIDAIFNMDGNILEKGAKYELR